MIAALIAFAIVLALCFFGIRIGFATLFVGFLGFALERGIGPAFSLMGAQVLETATSYSLSVIPLFVLMGVFIYRSDISGDLYRAAHARLGHYRGGLAHSTVLACAGFSAVCGSSLATAATMTRVALPPMRTHHYSDRLATGTIAAGGTLGIMIPPSVPLMIYGIIAEQDIGRLFIAGILPGAILVLSFMAAIVVWSGLKPEMAPPGEKLERKEGASAVRAVLPVLALFVLVLGGIYGRIFTPTEAAGIGATGAALIAMTRGHLWSFREWVEALVEASMTTASLFMVVFGTMVFAQYINLSGMPFDLMFMLQDMQLTPTGLVVGICVIALLLGMVFESLGILLLLVPVFMPALLAAQVDLIWFGIVIVLVTELGLITPPIGMNVFVVRSVVDDVRMADIFVGVLPFALAMLAVLALILALPGIATWLPGLSG
ncbi:TRAP transporter large permease [Pseudoroseicyclus tamaricis]|uniref:TRAP transporter large permease protein n=1 Tax=Pseudoroseicyclus tamaricis TaxID=2705421 RepID=A0A6B2JWY6_9RHOB|nr:TRAP transporter large permease [Pseudoroseicyclus tamaricis]NDV02425.1 TRAP transporter large permease [Pseudoroseicyclus tamaricis]